MPEEANTIAMPETAPNPPTAASSIEKQVESRHCTPPAPAIVEEALEKNDESTTTHNKSTISQSIWALRLAIFADAVNSQILGPNYALMVMKDGHEVHSFIVIAITVISIPSVHLLNS